MLERLLSNFILFCSWIDCCCWFIFVLCYFCNRIWSYEDPPRYASPAGSLCSDKLCSYVYKQPQAKRLNKKSSRLRGQSISASCFLCQVLHLFVDGLLPVACTLFIWFCSLSLQDERESTCWERRPKVVVQAVSRKFKYSHAQVCNCKCGVLSVTGLLVVSTFRLPSSLICNMYLCSLPPRFWKVKNKANRSGKRIMALQHLRYYTNEDEV